LACNHLVAFAAEPEAPQLAHWGSYSAPDHRTLIVTRWPDDPTRAALYDSRTATLSPLTETKDGACTESCESRVTFPVSGSGRPSMILTVRGSTVRATRDPIRITDFSFMHGDFRLQGRLWSPTSAGTHPAVLLIGGTGKNFRDDFRIYPYLLVKAGYVVLAFDKEGVGDSQGDRSRDEEGIDALADQNLAGVRALRRLDNVDPRQVGILGISHGAWVAVRAAHRDPQVAFVIAVVGGGVPLADATLFEVDRRLRKTQEPAAVQAGNDFIRRAFDALRSGHAEALPQLINGAKDQAWLKQTPAAPFVGAPDAVIVSIGKRSWADELSYDPKKDLGGLTIPVLAIEGERDESVPPLRNLAAFAAAGHGNVTTLLLRGANHLQALDDGIALRYSPQLQPGLMNWLRTLTLPP